MSVRPSVAVIIPAYNCEKTIARAIQSLLAQSVLPDEIIVVDDGSTDGTAAAIKVFPKVSYLFQKNSGPAAARNRGGFSARSDVILFTDSDCVPQKDWVEVMMRHFEDLGVSVVCGSYGIANPESLLAKGIHDEIMYRHRYLMPKYPRAFGSYNFGIRRDLFVQLKGFDETYPHASGEDNDLSYRILKMGNKILFEPRSLVDHFHTVRVGKYLREQYRHGFWRSRMYADHPEMMRGDDYTFWKDMIEVPLVLGSVLLLLLSAFGQVWIFCLYTSLTFAFMLLEFFYGIRMMQHLGQGLFWGGVMFLRAFARTFGFIHGVISLINKNNIKK